MPPVAIGVANPAATVVSGTTPGASTSSFVRTLRGVSSIAPNVSFACTAKPSTLERSKPGTSTLGHDIVGEDAVQCVPERNDFLAERREPEVLAEPGRRLVARDDVEKLGLAGFRLRALPDRFGGRWHCAFAFSRTDTQ